MNPDSVQGPAPAKADADDAEARGSPLAHGGTVLLHRQITGSILGAFYAVHSELGSGFLEAVYANALVVLLERAGLPVERQVSFEIMFHGKNIGNYRADLIVASSVVVEVKAGKGLIPQHTAQVVNYLKASGLQGGLLLNFGANADFRRVVLTGNSPRISA